jgi:hypothetical protein
VESLILKLGNSQVLLHSSSPGVEIVLQRFRRSFRGFVDKVNRGNNRVFSTILITSASNLESQPKPSWLSTGEYARWDMFCRKLALAYNQFNNIRAINTSPSKFSNPFSYLEPGQGIGDKQTQQIIGLVFDEIDDQTYLRIFGYALFLSLDWHVKHNNLCLHSAGVARLKKGFLFLGDSGGGKTTVTQLSASIGCLPLGDDINFILRAEDGYRLAASASTVVSPVGYSMEQPPLLGIFKLVKDMDDYLTPLHPMQLGPVLFNAFLQETPYVRRLPDTLIGIGFQTICSIARRVPGYVLHFRKSPDFWKLIDEKFPN